MTKNKSKNPCPPVVINAVPKDFQQLNFEDLEIGESFARKAIIGKICQLYPVAKRANGHTRKLLVTDAFDDESDLMLPVFLFNQFAEDSNDAASLEGYVILTNFLVEKSTRVRENEFPVQVLVNNKDCQIWFAKKVKSSKKIKSHTKNQTTIKTAVSHAEEESHATAIHQYEYTFLGDLHEADVKEPFNIYGVVEKCDLKITQGKGTQILDLILTDETFKNFICSIFIPKIETFPDIYPGDIVRVHRMQVYKFRNKLKGKCFSPKFILVFSKGNKGEKPRTVAKSFTFTSEDERRVNTLFTWYNKKSEPKLISEINRDDFVNIVCQVIGVYIAKTVDCVILKVWDGTKTNVFESIHLGIKEERLDEKLFSITRDYYVNLHVYDQHAAIAAELKPGQYIEVCDAHLYSPQNIPDYYKLCMHSGSKDGRGITVLELTDPKLTTLKERLEKILTDVQEFGNHTDDLLSQNNSLFLNCDISMFNSQRSEIAEMSQPQCPSALNRPVENTEPISDAGELNQPTNSRIEDVQQIQEDMDIDVLNDPLTCRTEEAPRQENIVISVQEAAVKPGESTQEFGGSQKEQVEGVEEEVSLNQPDPFLNKTPLEYRKTLHRAPSQETPTFLPLSSSEDEEWWNSVTTVSVTDGHSRVKPSSITEVIEREAPFKFRILCSALSYKPQTNSMYELCRLWCPKCNFITKDALPSFPPFLQKDELFYFHCPECSAKEANKSKCPVLKYTFMISFDLHDGRSPSSLDVLLWKDNAVKFFKGITPEQALSDKATLKSIFHMLWSICPNCKPLSLNETKENFHTYPILDCCVLSFKSSNGPMHQMFDTKLL